MIFFYTPLLFLISILLSVNTYGQGGANDPTFNPSDLGYGYGDGANYPIYTSAIQSDAKIIIGGNFTSYNGSTSNRIARLNADGSLDITFNPGT